MDGHYIHLLSNHFPIVLSITGFIILTVGLIKHTKLIKQIGLIVLITSSLFTLPAYLSGEEAEHRVEDKPGVSKSIIEEHEEEAEIVFILTDVLGILAFVALLIGIRDHKYSVWANRIVWLMAIVCIFFLFNVGKSGGQIRRPELRTAQVNEQESHHSTISNEYE